MSLSPMIQQLPDRTKVCSFLSIGVVFKSDLVNFYHNSFNHLSGNFQLIMFLRGSPPTTRAICSVSPLITQNIRNSAPGGKFTVDRSSL